jgi:hypothetical protein
MQEENTYNITKIFNSRLNLNSLGIKQTNNGIKSKLFEADADPGLPVIDPGKGGIPSAMSDANIFPNLSPNNPTGAGVAVVTNSAGTSVNKPSFGMGFELAPSLSSSVQQFVNQYADATDNSAVSRDYSEKLKTKFNLPPEDKVITWQTMNNAVANHLSQNLKQLLQQYGTLLPDMNYYENPNVEVQNKFNHKLPQNQQTPKLNTPTLQANPNVNVQSKFNPTSSQNQSPQTTTPKSNAPRLQGQPTVNRYSRDYFRIKSKNKPEAYS